MPVLDDVADDRALVFLEQAPILVEDGDDGDGEPGTRARVLDASQSGSSPDPPDPPDPPASRIEGRRSEVGIGEE